MTLSISSQASLLTGSATWDTCRLRLARLTLSFQDALNFEFVCQVC